MKVWAFLLLLLPQIAVAQFTDPQRKQKLTAALTAADFPVTVHLCAGCRNTALA